jgi:hypothetical protein
MERIGIEIRVGLAPDGAHCRVAGRSAKGKKMKLEPATLVAHGCTSATKTNPLPANG